MKKSGYDMKKLFVTQKLEPSPKAHENWTCGLDKHEVLQFGSRFLTTYAKCTFCHCLIIFLLGLSGVVIDRSRYAISASFYDEIVFQRGCSK